MLWYQPSTILNSRVERAEKLSPYPSSDLISVTPGGVSVLVLGIMQDAGLPHAGCRCSRCVAAYQKPSLVEYAACVAIVDTREQPPAVWLVDATPDIKYQLNMLAGMLGPKPESPDRLGQPAGIFLTHAHMGHTAGLAHLGPEAMNVQGLPVYASAGLVEVLVNTWLWRPLVGNLNLISLTPDQPLALGTDLHLIPIPVPHRDELGSGTFSYRVDGPARSLLYLPDIDDWSQWSKARDVVSAVDIAMVDASFYSLSELGNRPPVAHPLVPATLDFFAAVSTQIILTHFNHTNPLLDENSEAARTVAGAGVQVASTGLIFEL